MASLCYSVFMRFRAVRRSAHIVAVGLCGVYQPYQEPSYDIDGRAYHEQIYAPAAENGYRDILVHIHQ